MTESTDADLEALTALLDRLVEAPMQRALDDQFAKLDPKLDTQNRLLQGQKINIEVLSKEVGKGLGRVRTQLDDLQAAISQTDTLRRELAEAVQRVEERLTAIMEHLEHTAANNQAFQAEWQTARAADAASAKEHALAAAKEQQRQGRRLALLAPSAGLLSAAVVELAHWAF